MNRVISAFKKIRPSQILMTFLAGILLFVSTACGGGSRVQAQTPDGVQGRRQNVPAGELAVPGKAKNPRPEVPGGTVTSPSSDVINTFQGGRTTMNEFSDVDPRAADLEKAASDKAERLRQNAERNVIDETANVGETTRRILDKKGENAADLGKNLQRSAGVAKDKTQDTTENFAAGVRRGTENIKGNTLNATEGVNRSASRTAEDVKDASKDLTKGAKRATEDASSYAKDKANQAADSAQRNLNQAADSTQRNLDKAGNAVKDALN